MAVDDVFEILAEVFVERRVRPARLGQRDAFIDGTSTELEL
jgi:hypothetical protein